MKAPHSLCNQYKRVLFFYILKINRTEKTSNSFEKKKHFYNSQLNESPSPPLQSIWKIIILLHIKNQQNRNDFIFFWRKKSTFTTHCVCWDIFWEYIRKNTHNRKYRMNCQIYQFLCCWVRIFFFRSLHFDTLTCFMFVEDPRSRGFYLDNCAEVVHIFWVILYLGQEHFKECLFRCVSIYIRMHKMFTLSQ